MATELLEPLQRLSRDLKDARHSLSPREARYLVDLFYQIQENRKRASNQVAALTKSAEPHAILGWVLGANETLEGDIQRVLGQWAGDHVEGRWAQSTMGIGPVLSAGLLAHLSVEVPDPAVPIPAEGDDERPLVRLNTVGHWWRFAGLDPTVKWEKATKRPWNASLKVVCWKLAESFVKVQNNKNDVYGHVYAERRALEDRRNAEGLFAEQAAAALAGKNYGHDTEAYKAYSAGRLPDAHLYARAKRYAVKLFLAHYFHVCYETRFGEAPPKPYVIAILGHADYIGPPNWPLD